MSAVEVLLGFDAQDWRDDALCAQTYPDAMFPEKGGGTRDARFICSRCRVRAVDLGGTGECLEYALSQQERFGMWGGKSERERRAILRDRENNSGHQKRGAA